jgi:hypothetical protein
MRRDSIISIRQQRAYVSIRQHTSAYVSIRQHTSAYVSREACLHEAGVNNAGASEACNSVCRVKVLVYAALRY